MAEAANTIGWLYFVAIIFLFVLVVLWFLMPFAVFGTKPKLDVLIAEQRETNAKLAAIAELLRDAKTPTLDHPIT